MLTTEHPHSAAQEQHINEGEGANNESHSSPSSPLGGEDDYETKKPGDEKKSGRRKINIEFIEDKSRRHITFSKRKAGIMKKVGIFL
jgi:pheromone receptor transcription factor